MGKQTREESWMVVVQGDGMQVVSFFPERGEAVDFYHLATSRWPYALSVLSLVEEVKERG